MRGAPGARSSEGATGGRPCPASCAGLWPPKQEPCHGRPSGTVGTEPGGDSLLPWLNLCHPPWDGPRGQRAQHGPTRPGRGGSVGLLAQTVKDPRMSCPPHLFGWFSQSRRGVPSAGGVEKQDPQAPLGGLQTGAARPENSVEGPRTLTTEAPYDPAIPAPVYPAGTRPPSPGDIGTRGHRRVSAAARACRQPVPVGDSMLLGRKEENPPLVTTWLALEGTTLSDMSQPETDQRRAVHSRAESKS